jgi:signal transduction histidine kinase
VIWTSIRLRLLIVGGVAVLVLLAVAAIGLTVLFERHVERRATAELSAHLDQLVAGIERGEDGGLEVRFPPADQRYLQPFSGRYWQIDAAGDVLTSRSLWDSRLMFPHLAVAAARPQQLLLAGPDDEALLALVRRAILPPDLGGTTIWAVVALERSELRQAAHAFLRDLAPFLALLGVILVLAGSAQVAVGLRPLAKVGARVAAVRSGAASRLGGEFPTEVRPLAAEVDALIASREEAVRKARARASDLAHGLKTPLQALLGEADRLAECGHGESAEGIEETARAIERHVERELSRARIAAAGWAAASAPVAVVGPIVRVLQRTPEGEPLDWHVEGDVTAQARIDAGDLTEALGALLENAARHARTRVAVRIEAQESDILIRVQDDGAGVSEPALAHLPARGARLDLSKPGTGLGLAIASEICEAAGGELGLANLPGGFEARIRLPRVVAPDPR